MMTRFAIVILAIPVLYGCSSLVRRPSLPPEVTRINLIGRELVDHDGRRESLSSFLTFLQARVKPTFGVSAQTQITVTGDSSVADLQHVMEEVGKLGFYRFLLVNKDMNLPPATVLLPSVHVDPVRIELMEDGSVIHLLGARRQKVDLATLLESANEHPASGQVCLEVTPRGCSMDCLLRAIYQAKAAGLITLCRSSQSTD